MTRIGKCFETLKREEKKALIPFIVAGDPDLETTYQLVLAMAENGGDIIELGIPYSDPLADGPINQRAAGRALKNNIKIQDIMELVSRIREVSDVPLVYLVYFNCMLQYGLDRFLMDCERIGVDGLVIPDLPYEERINYAHIFERYSVDIIALAAPTSKDRIKNIVGEATGFIYCITSTGVTGTRSTFDADLQSFMKEVSSNTRIPAALGFGISTAEQVQQLKQHADGIIIGSAIVKRMEDSHTTQEIIDSVTSFVREIKAVL